MFEFIPEVIFGDKHSYNDWGVYWNGNSIDTPAPKKSFVEVPFRNGLLDLTGSQTDKIFYETRKLSFDFMVADSIYTWSQLYSMIMNDIHGKALHVTKTTDPDFYWDVYKCVISGAPEEEEGILKFTIECESFPYKLRLAETKKSILVNSSSTDLYCSNSRMELNPKFVTDQDVKVSFTNYKGETFSTTMSAGTHTYSNIEFRQGMNKLTFQKLTNNANVSVIYREGEL